MKTILASAYAVNPYKGSEDGMGWNFIYQIARFHKVIAVTRKNNREAIERFMQECSDPVYDNISFLYFDLPYYLRFWKKGSRGAMLYFWLWQRALPSFVKRSGLTFDIVHNVNFHNDWTPSYLWKLKKPFVWGPVGHHPLIPSQYLQQYDIRYRVKDMFTWMIKRLFWAFSLSLKHTRSKADHVLCMNSAAPLKLGLKPGRYSILPSVASEDQGYSSLQKEGFTLISAGRLVPLKGFDLSILAFAAFVKSVPENKKKKCRLVIVGSGPEKGLLQHLAIENLVSEQVVFINWIKRQDLMKMYEASSAFLFPSHEGAGMVVSEALSFGLPVICLDNNGPGEFITQECGIAVRHGNYEHTVQGLAAAINRLYKDPELLAEMSREARKRYEDHFNWNKRAYQLKNIYKTILS